MNLSASIHQLHDPLKAEAYQAIQILSKQLSENRAGSIFDCRPWVRTKERSPDDTQIGKDLLVCIQGPWYTGRSDIRFDLLRWYGSKQQPIYTLMFWKDVTYWIALTDTE